MNIFRTAILVAAMTALFMAVGALIGGQTGMMIALLFAMATNLFAYWNADKVVLKMYRAREVSARDAPELVSIVEQLAVKAQLPCPKIYIIENPQPNAFATGRNPENAAVAATTGLLKLLNRAEIEAVMAHELAHVKNHDTLTMTLTATLAGAISMLAQFGLFFGGTRNNAMGLVGTLLLVILAPLAAMMVQMAISRTREYAADKIGAEICGNPMALASALHKLHQGVEVTNNDAAERNPATAHMFIINPLRGLRFDNLFSTHPRVEERIERLSGMAGTGGAHRFMHQRDAERQRSTRRHGRRGPWG